MRLITVDGQGLYPWKSLNLIEKGFDFYYLQLDNGGFFFIPTRTIDEGLKERIEKII